MPPLILLALALALPAWSQGRGNENDELPARANPISISAQRQSVPGANVPSSLQQLMRMFLSPPAADGADIAADSGRIAYTPPAGYQNLEASAGPAISPVPFPSAPDRLRTLDLATRAPRPPARPAAVEAESRDANLDELTRLARRLNQSGDARDYPLSERAARRALAFDPGRPEPREQLSWSLFRQGRYAESLTEADAAVKRGPRRAFGRYLRALALERQGRRGEMRRDLEAAARLDPAAYSGHLRRVRLGEDLFRPAEEDNWPLFDRSGGGVEAPASAAWTIAGPAAAALGLTALFLLLPREWSAGRKLRRLTTARLSRAAHAWPGPRAWPNLAIWRRLQRLADTLWTRRASPPARPPQAPSGLLGGKYMLIRNLGPAGGPPVMQALDTSLGRSVAARVIWPGPGASRAEALARAKAAAALTHPNLADVYEVLDTGPRVWVVSEYAPGRPLSELIRAQGPLPASLALNVAAQALRALACAHEAGLAHGELEPSHLLLGAQGHVKLIHFGLARRGPPPKHPYSDAEGADPFAGDVQALGTCLYEALTGRHPLSIYDGERKEGRRFPSVRASRRELPHALDELVDRMLGGAGVPSARSALERLSRCARVLA